MDTQTAFPGLDYEVLWAGKKFEQEFVCGPQQGCGRRRLSKYQSIRRTALGLLEESMKPAVDFVP